MSIARLTIPTGPVEDTILKMGPYLMSQPPLSDLQQVRIDALMQQESEEDRNMLHSRVESKYPEIDKLLENFKIKRSYLLPKDPQLDKEISVGIDITRFRLPGKKEDDNNMEEDEDKSKLKSKSKKKGKSSKIGYTSWKEASFNARTQLMHQSLWTDNLRLLNEFGPEIWKTAASIDGPLLQTEVNHRKANLRKLTQTNRKKIAVMSRRFL